MLSNRTLKLIQSTLKFPTQFTELTFSLIKTPTFISPSNNYQLGQSKPLLTNIAMFTFSSSSSLPQSSLIPLVFKLRKQANQIKLTQGPTSAQHMQTLHHLAMVLVSYSYIDQAITVAQSMLKHYQQNYDKLTEKPFSEQTKRILYYQFLLNLYKVNQQFDRYFSLSNSLIHSYQILLTKQPHSLALVIDLYIDAGIAHFQLQHYDQSLKMLSIAVNLSLSIEPTDKTFIEQKIMGIKNIIGDILLHHKKQLDEAFLVLNQNLTQIKKTPKDEIEHQTVSNCLLNLTETYAQKIPNLTIQQTVQYLKTVNTFVKSVENKITEKQIDTKTILKFYQNLAKLYIHAKDYNKAILSYRLQREQIAQNDLISLALCYQNQAKVHEMTNKIQKAAQKLNKAWQKRQKIYGIYADKKRKTLQQQNILKENKTLMIETSTKLIELQKKTKNNKKAQQWTIKHQKLLSL